MLEKMGAALALYAGAFPWICCVVLTVWIPGEAFLHWLLLSGMPPLLGIPLGVLCMISAEALLGGPYTTSYGEAGPGHPCHTRAHCRAGLLRS